MTSNLPEFECSFPAPPARSVGGGVCGLAVSGSWGSGAGAAQQGMRQGKLLLIGTRRGDSEMDPAHADLYQRADLEQFQPDAAATGPGELGEGQTDAAQRTEQHVGKRGEPQAQLIGAHGGRRGAISKQVQLAFLDPIFHLTTGTVDPLIQPPGVDLGGWQRGDDEAWIGLALGPFGLADDAPDAAPTVQGGPAEVLEATGRLAGSLRRGTRGGHLGGDLPSQPRIARQAKDIVHAIGLAP